MDLINHFPIACLAFSCRNRINFTYLYRNAFSGTVAKVLWSLAHTDANNLSATSVMRVGSSIFNQVCPRSFTWASTCVAYLLHNLSLFAFFGDYASRARRELHLSYKSQSRTGRSQEAIIWREKRVAAQVFSWFSHGFICCLCFSLFFGRETLIDFMKNTF